MSSGRNPSALPCLLALRLKEEAVLRQRIAQVQLNSALAPRERKRIRAPFDGVVTDKLISVGERYNEPAPMLVVARIDPLHIEAYLPAAQHGRPQTKRQNHP
jgi:multidrug resistance efflux pump